MRAILTRLCRFRGIKLVPIGNTVIFNEDVENWPVVQFLVCFYSSGFPLQKAEEYVKLRQPICFNDVLSQHVLLDRRKIYAILTKNQIPTAPYAIYNDVILVFLFVIFHHCKANDQMVDFKAIVAATSPHDDNDPSDVLILEISEEELLEKRKADKQTFMEQHPVGIPNVEY